MTEPECSSFTLIEASIGGEPALPEYMKSRKGIYYFKRKVPTDVSRLLDPPIEQVWKSLRTGDLEQAKKRLKECIVEFDKMVNKARQKAVSSKRRVPKARAPGTTKYLQEAHIPALLERYAFFLLETDDEERTDIGRIREKLERRQARKERLALMEEGVAYLREQAADEDYSEHEEVAQQLLKDELLIAPPGSEVRKMLLKGLLHLDLKLMKAQLERVHGDVDDTPKTVPIAPRDMPTLFELHARWERSQTIARTKQTYMSFVEKFEALHGALPVAGINGEHVDAYVKHLAKEGVTRETARNHISGLATLVREGLDKKQTKVVANPFENVSLLEVPEASPSEDRRAYEMWELQKLFLSPLYCEGYRPTGQNKEASYWAPLLGLFVGGRLEEIAQLTLADILRINGAWVVRIANLDPDQHLKTETSYRQVPLHQELIKCGLLVHVAAMRSASERRLFPSQKNNNQDKRWGPSLGSWYGRYLDSLDLKDPRLDFHSFRFNFKQQCTHCGIENEARDALTGHWIYQNRASRGYMRQENRQYPLPPLVEAIAKLRYEELDLSHLYVSDPMFGVTWV
ncbi:MAG: site-specific integrase [Hydrogenophaga sp.]|nr:site-specific integrase [Hydrogenophaga sp.]